MPPRNPELPEGTDQIINGAADLGGGSTGSTGLPGSTGTSQSDGGAGSGFIGGTGSSGSTGSPGSSGSSNSESSGGGIADKVVSQVREQVSSLRDQATGKVRDYANDGKSRATDALDEVSAVIREAADSLDNHLGNDVGEYARRAAGVVQDFAESIRGKQVDELYDNARSAVRKSPAVVIGTAAVLGFVLVRLVKTGIDDLSGGNGQGGATRGGGGGSIRTDGATIGSGTAGNAGGAGAMTGGGV